MARSLVDTNILIYSRDLNEPAKRTRAIEVIDQLGGDGDLVLSAQCLNEFSSASLRRGTPITEVNRTGFVGGPIPRQDVAYGTTEQVLP